MGAALGRSDRIYRWIVWVIWSLGMWLAAGSAWSQPMVLQDTRSQAHWGQHLTVLEDPAGRMTLDEVTRTLPTQWRANTSPDLNLGYSRSAFWVRVDLRNVHATQRDWILGLRYPLLDYLDVYVVTPQGQVTSHQTGDRRPFDTRPIAERNFFFPLTLPPGQQATLYLRVQSQGSLQAPLTLSTPTSWQEAIGQEHVLLGVYSGALLAMLVYNLLLFISLRERTYLYYVAYLASFGLTQLVFNGMAYQFLWPNSPNWGNRAAPIFMGLTGLLLTLFSRDFLSLKQNWLAADRVVRVSLWLFAVVMVGGMVLDYMIPIRFGTAITILSPVMHLIITAVMLRRGYRLAQYFLAAFGGLLIGIALAALQAYSVLGTSIWTEYSLQIGSLLEITLLSFALAHRLKLAQEANIRLQTAHAAELEDRVQARTLDLDRALLELTQANTRLHDLTVRDALTGIYNRQFLNERLPQIWRQAQRWHQAISVLMIDIDHFKHVNDHHGHAAGDQALKLVAEALAGQLGRPGDLAVRYGGEEFLALLPQTDIRGASHVAERLRQTVEALHCQINDQTIKLTVSIGVAQSIPTPHSRLEDLLHEADQLLYQAKRQGRNRCVIQSQEAPSAPQMQT